MNKLVTIDHKDGTSSRFECTDTNKQILEHVERFNDDAWKVIISGREYVRTGCGYIYVGYA